MPTQEEYDEEARVFRRIDRGLTKALNVASSYRGERWAYETLIGILEYELEIWESVHPLPQRPPRVVHRRRRKADQS